MKAEILPLNGKYYGTEIVIEDDNHDTTIKIWCNADFIPSDRWLDECGITRTQYDNNEIIDVVSFDGKSVYKTNAREECDICDSHFESKWTFEVAKKIAAILNFQ